MRSGKLSDYARCPLCGRVILRSQLVEGPDGLKVGKSCLKKALQKARDESILQVWKDS